MAPRNRISPCSSARIARSPVSISPRFFPSPPINRCCLQPALPVNFGADASGRGFSFAPDQPGLAGLSSGGQIVHVTITTIGGVPTLIGYVGNDPALAANHVFTVSLDAASTIEGIYTFTLLRPLDHPISGAEDTLHLTINVIATDGSGDVAP